MRSISYTYTCVWNGRQCADMEPSQSASRSTSHAITWASTRADTGRQTERNIKVPASQSDINIGIVYRPDLYEMSDMVIITIYPIHCMSVNITEYHITSHLLCSASGGGGGREGGGGGGGEGGGGGGGATISSTFLTFLTSNITASEPSG